MYGLSYRKFPVYLSLAILQHILQKEIGIWKSVRLKEKMLITEKAAAIAFYGIKDVIPS